MALVVVLTIAAFADGISRMGIAITDRIWIETWRTFAYMMFAGLFARLALRQFTGDLGADLHWRSSSSESRWATLFPRYRWQ
jgi:hypothetical protein